jgi:hypothetical protein
MLLNILSCGILQFELNKIIPKIKQELKKHDIEINFLSPGLHVDYNKMETEVITNLEAKKGEKILLLYGSMCHTKLVSIAKDYNAILPVEKNCIEMILSPDKKGEMDGYGNVFYITAGWLRHWREIFQDRTAIAPCDKIVMLDYGGNLISDEELLEFFDYMQIPIETIEISLDYFTNKIINLCKNIEPPYP